MGRYPSLSWSCHICFPADTISGKAKSKQGARSSAVKLVAREDNSFHTLFSVQQAPRPNREINLTIQNQAYQETHYNFTVETSCELFQSFKHI